MALLMFSLVRRPSNFFEIALRRFDVVVGHGRVQLVFAALEPCLDGCHHLRRLARRVRAPLISLDLLRALVGGGGGVSPFISPLRRRHTESTVGLRRSNTVSGGQSYLGAKRCGAPKHLHRVHERLML